MKYVYGIFYALNLFSAGRILPVKTPCHPSGSADLETFNFFRFFSTRSGVIIISLSVTLSYHSFIIGIPFGILISDLSCLDGGFCILLHCVTISQGCLSLAAWHGNLQLSELHGTFKWGVFFFFNFILPPDD